jgi:hypothetical protein
MAAVQVNSIIKRAKIKKELKIISLVKTIELWICNVNSPKYLLSLPINREKALEMLCPPKIGHFNQKLIL